MNRLLNGLLYVTLLELFLGGGGRFTPLGDLTLRMYLFLAGFIISIWIILKERKIDIEVLGLIIIFSTITTISAITGYLNNAPQAAIYEDVKPLSFFYAILFFSIAINNRNKIQWMIRLIIFSSIVMAIAYIVILSLAHLGFFTFDEMYQLVYKTDEVHFRKDKAFVYKGFFYMCAGLFFIIYNRKIRYRWIWISLVSIAILLTFTRGFLIAIGLTLMGYFLYAKLNKGNKATTIFNIMYQHKYKVSLFVILIISGTLLLSNIYSETFDRKFSNFERMEQIKQVAERVDLASVLIGHGFGIGVPIKQVHMEISYLEIFHKQGLMGLFFWVVLFWFLIRNFNRIHNPGDHQLAVPFLLGVVFAYFVSATNPYINNPIGLTMIITALVSFKVLSEDNNTVTFKPGALGATMKGRSTKEMLSYIKTRVLGLPATNYNLYQLYFRDKKGLEIGGPSKIFKENNLIPVYPIIQALDGCNFSRNTLWEGTIEEGNNYNFLPFKKGYQFISDAVDLGGIKSGKYDFILASHCLEHIANPLKALKEWIRILKENGLLLLVLPDKKYTFDHRRTVSSFEHLLKDLENDINEDDMTHLDEILTLHDLSMDIPAGNFTSFKKRSLQNFENRCLHHHVFDLDLLIKVFGYLNLKILDARKEAPFHLVILGQKVQ